jgi:hypothetical protein
MQIVAMCCNRSLTYSVHDLCSQWFFLSGKLVLRSGKGETPSVVLKLAFYFTFLHKMLISKKLSHSFLHFTPTHLLAPNFPTVSKSLSLIPCSFSLQPLSCYSEPLGHSQNSGYSMYVCMYVCKGVDFYSPCTSTHSGLLCHPRLFRTSPQWSETDNTKDSSLSQTQLSTSLIK